MDRTGLPVRLGCMGLPRGQHRRAAWRHRVAHCSPLTASLSTSDSRTSRFPLRTPNLPRPAQAALLVAGMKSQELKSVGAEGTLIGTALGAAFSLWGLGAMLLYGVAYLLQLRPRLAQA